MATLHPVQGRWKLTSSENFEEYMRVVGVGLIARKVGDKVSMEEYISQDGDEWTVVIYTKFKNYADSFRIDQEYNQTTFDGRKYKSTFRVEGNKLVLYQTGLTKSDVNSTVTRELDAEGNMIMTLEPVGHPKATSIRTFIPVTN